MKTKPWKTGAFCGALLCGGAVAAWAMSSGITLKMNGKVASGDVRTINGKTYVPLADVARALNMKIVKSGGGWEIKKAGGTYQVQDLSGNIGDVLFDGKWRLQVLSVQSPETFSMRTEAQPYGYDSSATYNMKTRVLRPQNGYKLVVINVRITNGQKITQSLWTSISDKRMRTALTDFNGGSHPPIDYDYDGGPTVTQPMLPGARMTFPIIFSVPQNVVASNFVMTLKNNDSFAKGNDARVSLAE